MSAIRTMDSQVGFHYTLPSDRFWSRLCENSVGNRRCKNPASPEARRVTIGMQAGVLAPPDFG